MFLYQKFEYDVRNITLETFETFKAMYENDPPKNYSTFDTETNGLHTMTAKPFLYTFGYTAQSGTKVAFWFEPTKELVEKFVELTSNRNICKRLFAHNCKFDYHMTWNILDRCPIEWDTVMADGLTIARLTSFADNEHKKINLETLGVDFVDENAKFAGKVIKSRISALNKERKDRVKALFYKKYGSRAKFSEAWVNFNRMTPYIDDNTEYNIFFKENYIEANYYDVYKLDPDLMVSYAIDDVVILNEYLAKALKSLMIVDPKLKIFNTECQLISAIARMEKTGMKVDLDYTLESRVKLSKEINLKYDRLKELTGREFSIGQHKLIKELFLTKWGIKLEKVDSKLLKNISEPQDAAEAAALISRLRTLEKYMTTYIDGKLKQMVNGRIYPTVNNSGTVSGRVSSNMQQQPKKALYYDDGETVLFHTRKMFITDDDYVFVFED